MHGERYPDWLRERFWSKVDKSGECWMWIAGGDGVGYGRFWNAATKEDVGAHRVAYEMEVGPIPSGLQLDHLCRVRRCVNPAHLEPVTIAENLRRGVGISALNALKTHCVHGHPLSGENLYRSPKGDRSCMECRRRAATRFREKLRRAA